jgi:hypothetical protein
MGLRQEKRRLGSHNSRSLLLDFGVGLAAAARSLGVSFAPRQIRTAVTSEPTHAVIDVSLFNVLDRDGAGR